MKRLYLYILISLFPLLSAHAQTYQWIEQAGGPQEDYSESIAVDDSGNAYITGIFTDSCFFDGNVNIQSKGNGDIFLAKYDSSGTLLWLKTAGGANEDGGLGVCLDASRNVYITGFISDTAMFGIDSLFGNGLRDIFVAKYSNAGTLIWVKSAGGAGNDKGNSIAVDDSGHVFITGMFSDTVMFNSTFILAAQGMGDIFIAHLDTGLQWKWVTQAGGTGDDAGQDIALGMQGEVYVTGYFYGQATFGDTTLNHNGDTTFYTHGESDAFLARYNHDTGKIKWFTQAGGPGFDYGNGVAADGFGNIYITGSFFDSAYFAPASLSEDIGAGLSDIFLAKYDSSGNFLWVREAGSPLQDYGIGLALDNAGNPHITGAFSDTCSFGALSLISGGSYDIFTAGYSPQGDLWWVKQAGGTGDDRGYDIAISHPGADYITGIFSESCNFANFNIQSVVGSGDIFIAKINSTGESIREIASDGKQLFVYPNPSSGSFNVLFQSTGNIQFKLFNPLGQNIREETLFPSYPYTPIPITIDGVSPGMYFVEIITGKGIMRSKLIIR